MESDRDSRETQIIREELIRVRLALAKKLGEFDGLSRMRDILKRDAALDPHP